MSFGKELVQSAEEALAIARCEIGPAGVFVPETVDVVAISKRPGLSQTALAQRYGLPLGTLRDRERHRRSPDRAALVLLALTNRNPQVVADTIVPS